MSEVYKFEKFIGDAPPKRGHTMPQNMAVGQIVVRRGVTRGTIAGLKSHMRKAMGKGTSFSIEHTMEHFAIRRDS